MRRLKAKHLTLRCDERLDLPQWRSRTRRDHQLRWLIRNDTTITARVETLGHRCVVMKFIAIKILGTPRTNRERLTLRSRRVHLVHKMSEFS
jgi:hypothetical protein